MLGGLCVRGMTRAGVSNPTLNVQIKETLKAHLALTATKKQRFHTNDANLANKMLAPLIAHKQR